MGFYPINNNNNHSKSQEKLNLLYLADQMHESCSGWLLEEREKGGDYNPKFKC